MTFPSLPSDHSILILAPIGQDARIASQVLEKAGMTTEVLSSISELCLRLNQLAGVLLLTEEAILPDDSLALKAQLKKQEPWSDLPIILLTSQKERIFGAQKILDALGTGGNISILERPFRLMTLVTAVQVALRARKRQYQVRDLLSEQAIALKQRDEFLSIASHELKTPITSLKLQIQMRRRILSKGDKSYYSPAKVDALLELSEAQIERLSRLVEDMLDISRIVNGKLILNREEISLGVIVKEVLNSFQPQFEAAKCSVELQIENFVIGYWDRYRVEQVVTNLFTNAIKYGTGKPVHIYVRQRGSHAVLVVQDKGIGIRPADQERIFQRFERAVSASNVSGLGLGLFISRQILEQHGGKIRVESEVGKGSSFIVEFPAILEKNPHASK